MAAGVTLQEAGARDEVDLVDKAAALVLHRDDHLRQARDVIAAAGAGQPGLRPCGIADAGRIEVAEAVDLRAPHEADVDIAALQQQQHVGRAQHHIGPLGATLFIGRGRQCARFDHRPDHTAFEQDRQARAPQALCGRGSQQGNAHTRKHDLSVAKQARAHHRQQFACRKVPGISHWRGSFHGARHRAAHRGRASSGIRSSFQAPGRSGRCTASCHLPDRR
ncbi:hypothetical protein D9M72_319490 [compost metagenome]